MSAIISKVQGILIIIILIITTLISSCKISYLVSYQTYLNGYPKDTLLYNDSIIKVKFETKPNGIYFDIENLTKNNLYLIWDKSYFIKPNGESSKALNSDVLETNSSIGNKENYESIIPQNGHFDRYTCSSKDISFFQVYKSTVFYNEATKVINTYTDYSEFYKRRCYWYLGEKKQYSGKKEIPSLDKQEISKIQEFVNNNDKLAMGFTIRNKEKEIEYHFEFPIKKVEIYKKIPTDVLYIKAFELSKNNHFQILNIDLQK
jgi:hypothetical protein